MDSNAEDRSTDSGSTAEDGTMDTGSRAEDKVADSGSTAEDGTVDAGAVAEDISSDADSSVKEDIHAPAQTALDEAFQRGRIAGLQEAILAIMSKNGPITDQMRRDVIDNVYPDSLINWVKSFR